MTTQATIHTTPIARPNLLRNSLRIDGIISAATGAISLAAAEELAPLLGIQPPLAFSIAGAVLIVYGGLLLYISTCEQISRRIVIAAIILDVLWVIDSAVLLIGGWLPLTSAGVWTIALLAVGVAVLGELKSFGLWRMRRTGG
jgi:hypothetical protein